MKSATEKRIICILVFSSLYYQWLIGPVVGKG
jgi:hypothetical protein